MNEDSIRQQLQAAEREGRLVAQVKGTEPGRALLSVLSARLAHEEREPASSHEEYPFKLGIIRSLRWVVDIIESDYEAPELPEEMQSFLNREE